MSGEPLAFAPVAGWPAAAALRDEWLALAQESGTWLPFQEPDWCEEWWRHWPRRHALRRDAFALWVGRDAGGRVRALMPTVRRELPGRGPLRLRVLHPVGPDPNVTELQPLLCRPEDLERAHAGLQAELARRRGEWDAVRWLGVPGPIAAALRARPRVWRLRDLPDFLLPLGGDWERFRASLPRNVKEALRKARNAPARAGMKLDFAVLRSEDEARCALPEFFRLHALRARAGGLAPHRDTFARAEARAFLADLVLRWSREGLVRFFTLRHGERVIACRLAFERNGTLYLYYSGFAPEYAPYSVMTRTVAEGLEWAAGRGVHTVNLSTGEDVSKTRWRPLCLPYELLWQCAPSARGALARLLIRLGRGEREIAAP